MDNFAFVVIYLLGIITGIAIFQYCIRKGISMTYEIQDDIPREKTAKAEIADNYIEGTKKLDEYQV